MLQDKSPPKPQHVHNTAGSPSRFNRKYVPRRQNIRQCTLVKTVPAINMPAQISTKAETKIKKEVELVSEKVTKTRHEIEELKAQLQQLINEGISKTDFTETRQNLSDLKAVSNDKINEIKEKTFKDNVADSFKSVTIEKKLKGSILKPTVKQTNQDEPGKKVRHYDQEMARMYIKKQKEKRKEELSKNKKEVVTSVDLKKQRLQQLREKSLRLLSKNIELNRARSRSRSREAAERNNIPESKQFNSAVTLNSKASSLENLHPQFQNITIRSPQSNNVDKEDNDLLRHKSALKIQAVFRGYRQRKIYEKLKKRKHYLVEHNVSKEVQTQDSYLHIPTVIPYPHNFITAVKRKLNLVTQEMAKARTADVAIQSSLVSELKSPNLDLKSFLSHKCLDMEPLTLINKQSNPNQVTLENGCGSESDTSKNIPELSSEGSISESLQKKSMHSTKRSHSSGSDQKLTISVEGVKKLKLKPKSLESEVSEHLDGDVEISRISASRNSIISSNKCNYVTYSPKKSLTEELKSVSIVSTVAEGSNQKTYMKEKDVKDVISYNFDNKENISQITTTQDRSNKISNGYSSNFTNVSSDIPMLEPPKISLKTTLPVPSSENSDEDSTKKLITSVTLRAGEKSTLESKTKTNEIHLKFEAELHLLNDFNDSLRRVMAVEKSLLELHDKKNETALTYETRDTQTSVNQQYQVASINYSRGSDITEALSFDKDLSIVTTGLELSPFNSPIEESNSEASVVEEKLKSSNVLGGISLEMFEQLIKDEDARIENLKAILKIREKSLVDRTKGELAWLEIQKKHLRDAGQLQEISAIKKKQRGLLIKLEHERHEMQRLKQMQKAASKERKSVLREQRNMIKAQLAAGNTVTRIKRNTREEKRQSGPFKVYNIKSQNDSFMSETSVTRKSSITEEVVSATSNRSHSIVSHISEELVLSEKVHVECHKDANVRTEHVKRSLLMREAALQKRKKVAEELLQWHQRLLEEERKITELEVAASAIINQVPITKDLDESMNSKQKFKGSQLNQLWLSLTGRQEKKFKDEEIYNMSQNSLEKFCKNAKKYERVIASHKRSRADARKPIKSKTTIPIEDVTRSNSEISEYLSDFESTVTTSSVSEPYQTSDNSTLSSHEIQTVTEISKPRNGNSTIIELNHKNREIVNENISDEVQSVEKSEKTESLNSTISSSKHAEHEQDNSSHIVNEILSEIDKYLESQSNKSENVNDVTTASKSITKDDTEDKLIDIAQISSVGCDKIRVIEEVSDIDELTSTIAEGAIKSTIRTENESKSELVRIEDSDNFTEVFPNVSVHDDEIKSTSCRDVATSTFSSNMNIDESSKIGSITENITKPNTETEPCFFQERLEKTSASVSESNHCEKSVENCSQLSTGIKSRLNSIHDELILSSLDNGKEVSELSESSKLSSDENTKQTETGIISKKYTDGISCISELFKNGITKISESKHDTNFLSLLEESNKSSAEDTTISTASELNKSSDNLTKHYQPSSDSVLSLNKIDEQETFTSIKKTDRTSNSKFSEDLNKSEQTQSNAFYELPFRSVGLQLTCTNSKVISNGDLPEKKHATISSLTEIEEDEISVKIATDTESLKLTLDDNHKVSNDEKSIVSETCDINEKSSSETINSITEIEEDQKSVACEDDTEMLSKNSSAPNFSDCIENQVEQESKTNFINENSDGVEENLTSISEVAKNTDVQEQSAEIEDSSSEESTEPRLLLSYGYIDDHNNRAVKDEETSSSNLVSSEDCKEKPTDIKKRVSEILADANISSPRGDKSPRLQDFYVTAYDVVSPNSTPETTSPTDESQQNFPTQNVFVTDEVEELLKKQLEIEQEIKAIQQQQKEQLPYLYVREIPNKPPPPYTPPINAQSSIKGSILPSCEGEINTITNASAQILHKAAVSNTIKDVALTDNAKKYLELKNNVEGQCYEFLFDLSKEFALEHYKYFEPETGPSWAHLQKRTKLAIGKPLDQMGLQKFINKKVKQVLGYEIVKSDENFKHKWSGKKRDNVDELLVVECQGEEAEWTNYDKDELIVKDELTKEIMNMLLSETGQVLNNILSKKKYLC
ncbi:hypothetical protein RN001_009966 [Aquatica leii]|uniref:Centrosome-associated protein 350 n=1 Tax=Aquatica leii TaxID=1421715 RepID=A0AAN7Q2V8_9COLE|nr:hypothetical protein RN001_009966 [Aquatica leii]